MVDPGGSVALVQLGGQELPLSGVAIAADARGHDPSLSGWRRTCERGITLSIAQCELQAGVCACRRP